MFVLSYLLWHVPLQLHFFPNLEKMWWAETALWRLMAVLLYSFSKQKIEPEKCMWLRELWT